MRVIVIGCGLAGVTTAYYLRSLGAEVTVLDRAAAPARETSYANGSMLTPSLADPWNAPGALGVLLRSVGREGASLLLRPSVLPSLLGWGLRFYASSSRSVFESAYLNNVRLALYSQTAMRDLLQTHSLEFEYAPDGTIKVFADQDAFEQGRRVAHWLKQVQVGHREMDRDALLALEPALAPVGERLVGGIHYPGDEVGNARLFCEALKAVAEEAGVVFRFSEQISGRQPAGPPRRRSGDAAGDADRGRLCACCRRVQLAAGKAVRAPGARAAGEGVFAYRAGG